MQGQSSCSVLSIDTFTLIHQLAASSQVETRDVKVNLFTPAKHHMTFLVVHGEPNTKKNQYSCRIA